MNKIIADYLDARLNYLKEQKEAAGSIAFTAADEVHLDVLSAKITEVQEAIKVLEGGKSILDTK